MLHIANIDLTVPEQLEFPILAEMGYAPERYKARRLDILTAGTTTNGIYPLEVVPAEGDEGQPLIFWVKSFKDAENFIKELKALRKLEQASERVGYRLVHVNRASKTIITEHIPNTVPVSLGWSDLNEARQLATLKGVARGLARLNAGGVYQNDAQAKNFLLPILNAFDGVIPEVEPIDFEYNFIDDAAEDAINLTLGREIFIAQQFRTFFESLKSSHKLSEESVQDLLVFTVGVYNEKLPIVDGQILLTRLSAIIKKTTSQQI
jgi:tRNA A-37 threonylcarbamoyl transferase component Bud32